ncbi:MAG: anti-sigma factor [Pseudonocardiales bacterium]|nr:anti-sigma factor [Pseudonocardiales bacterium]
MTPPPSRRAGEPSRAGQAQHPEAELGAYLLAALPPEQEADLERHVLGCALCQDRLVELSEVLPALGHVAIEDAIALIDGPASAVPESAPGLVSASTASATPTRSEASVLSAEPIRSGATSRALARWRVAAAAGGVAAAAAAAILVAVVIGSNDETSGQAAGPTASSSASVVPVAFVGVFPYTGDDQVTVRAWNSPGGTDIAVQCHNDRIRPAVIDPNGATYELWALRDDGVSYKVSSWKTVYGDATFPGRLDFPVDRITSFELRSAGEVLSVVR